MRIVLWTVFVIVLLMMWGRETHVYVQARRDKPDFSRDMRRFKRRSIGLFLLLLLGLMYDLSSVISDDTTGQPPSQLYYELAFYGAFFGVLVALLIIVLRDFRDIAELYSEDRTRMTLETLVELERELGPDSGDEFIPRLEFPKREQEDAPKEE